MPLGRRHHDTCALGDRHRALDIKAKQAREPLHRLLGGARASVDVYASAINLHLTKEQLLAQVEDHLGQGYSAFKLKIGRADADEDLDRCRAARKLIGTRALMLDVNQKWTAGEAVQRCRAARGRRTHVRRGAPALRRRGGPRTCASAWRRSARTRRAALQPLRILELRAGRSRGLRSARRLEGRRHHRMDEGSGAGAMRKSRRVAARALEISMHLAGATPNCSMVENIFGLNLFDFGATAAPVAIKNGAIALLDERDTASSSTALRLPRTKCTAPPRSSASP